MLALKAFRDKAKGTADLLNFAALVDDGLVLGKDGSLLAGWFFRGPDSQSATADELNYTTSRINAALARLGTGFALWIDAVRLPAARYPAKETSYFPDAVTAAIEAERRAQFLAEGAHYESEYALLLMYTPPLRRQTKIADLIYDDDPEAQPQSPGERQMAHFKRVLADLEDGLADILKLCRMKSYRVVHRDGRVPLQDELVNYLHFCVTGHLEPLNIPPCTMYLDAWLGMEELCGGDTPKMGESFIAAVAIEGFPPQSYPNILAGLESLAIPYRFSSRFIPLDPHEAVEALSAYRRKWRQWMRGFWQQVFRTEGGLINEDAALMARETEAAITDASSNLVAFGYYTPVIILRGEAREPLLDQARLIARAASRRLRHTGGDGQYARGLSRLDPRSCTPQCPAALDPQPQSCRPDAGRFHLAGAGRLSLAAVSAFIAAAAPCRHNRVDAFPSQSACLGCRPYADLRPDRGRQIDAPGVAGRSVPPL